MKLFVVALLIVTAVSYIYVEAKLDKKSGGSVNKEQQIYPKECDLLNDKYCPFESANIQCENCIVWKENSDEKM